MLLAMMFSCQPVNDDGGSNNSGNNTTQEGGNNNDESNSGNENGGNNQARLRSALPPETQRKYGLPLPDPPARASAWPSWSALT